MKRNIKRLYFYYTFNRPNAIILGLSLLILTILFNTYDFDISSYNYLVNKEEYHLEYLSGALSYAIPLSLVVIMLVISIDYMMNRKRFDLIFISKLKPNEILKCKLYVYLLMALVYSITVYTALILTAVLRFDNFYLKYDHIKLFFALMLQDVIATLIIFLIIRITKIVYSSIIIMVLYFISLIISDYSEVAASIIFVHIDMYDNVIGIGILPIFLIAIIYYFIIVEIYGKKELK